MKVHFLIGFLSVASVALSQPSNVTDCASALPSPPTYQTHPFRQYGGRLYDFSDGIQWRQDQPGATCPYPAGSSLAQDWEVRQQKFIREGQKWARYLVGATVEADCSITVGEIIQEREDGWVISVPATKVRDPVTGSSAGPEAVGTTDSPADTKTTEPAPRQVFLVNAPSRPVLPVFALPVGRYSVGSTVLETFDYGTPLNYLPTQTPPATLASGVTVIKHDKPDWMTHFPLLTYPTAFQFYDVFRNNSDMFRNNCPQLHPKPPKL